MVKQNDNFFSPERLRGKWAKKKSLGKNGQVNHDDMIGRIVPEGAHKALYDNILSLIKTRFSGQELEILRSLTDELKIQLDLRFDKAERLSPIPGEDACAVDTAIDQILAGIEDLVEVF